MSQIKDQNRDRKRGARDDAYFLACAIAGVGGVASAMYGVLWPVLVALIIAVVVVLVLIVTEIVHERAIETIQTNGLVDVEKIAASKPIETTYRALPSPTNIQRPQIAAPTWTKLIQNEEEKILLRNKWGYVLRDGSEARGDLISAIVEAAHTERDDSGDIRDYIRNKYKLEFSNGSYSRAIRALQESGAVDRAGAWQIEPDSIDDLLNQMREQSSLQNAN